MHKKNRFSIRNFQRSVVYIIVLIIINFTMDNLADHGQDVGDVDEFSVSILSSKTFNDLINPEVSYSFVCEKLTEYAPAHWTYKTYFDNQKSMAYVIEYESKKYSFAIIQRDPEGAKISQIWAVSKDYRDGKNPETDRIAVQITDFIGNHYQFYTLPPVDGEVEVDNDGELDEINGIYYVHTRETYKRKKNYRKYKTGTHISTVIAVNIKQLLLDALSNSIKSKRYKYYTKICDLEYQTNISYCGWGVVYDWESSFLYVATTGEEVDYIDDNRIPDLNRLIRLHIDHPIQFTANTHIMEKTVLGEYSTENVQISHLMINPWDPKYIAIDNYAYIDENNPTEDPSSLVLFDFHHDSDIPILVNLLLPEGYNRRNGFSHMSFVDEHYFITSHREANRGLFINFPSISNPKENVIFREVWPTRFDEPVNRGVVHSACSKDKRFIVSDMGLSDPDSLEFDSLFLWYQTSTELYCTPFIDGINESENSHLGPHPHASFIDDANGENRIILFNVREPEPPDVRPEIWQFTIPNDIYNNNDLVPFF